MIATALSACGEKTEAPKENEKPVVKIGVILPLSGNNSAMGEASKKAMLMAIADNTKQSNKYNYEIIFEDNQMITSKTAVIANKLININKVDVISSFFSAHGFVVAPIAEKHKILHFCNTWESENVLPLGEYTFLQGTSWESIYKKYLQEFNDKKVKKIALFVESRGANPSFAKGFYNLLKNNDIDAVIEEYNVGTRDFRMLIQKYKSNNYNFFWFMGIPPESDILLRQMHELGINNSNIYAVGADTGTEYNLYNNIKFYGYNTGSNQFKERLNMKQNYGASVSYDIISLIISAFEFGTADNHIWNHNNIINYIKSKNVYDCVSGGCKVLPNNFIVNPASYRRFVNGQPVVVEE